MILVIWYSTALLLRYSVEANPKTDIQIIVMVDHENDLNQFFVLNGWTIAKYRKEKKIKEEKLMTSFCQFQSL